MYTFQNKSKGKIKKLKLLEENIGVSGFVLQKTPLKKSKDKLWNEDKYCKCMKMT